MATINKIQANGTTYDIAVNGANVSGAVASAGTLTNLTATVAELNYVDGVTSNIQTQLDNKVNKADMAVPVNPTAAQISAMSIGAIYLTV